MEISTRSQAVQYAVSDEFYPKSEAYRVHLDLSDCRVAWSANNLHDGIELIRIVFASENGVSSDHLSAAVRWGIQ